MSGRGFAASRFSAKKGIVLAVSFLAAVLAWAGAYAYFSSQMTPSQKNAPIDVKNGSGLTRAKAYIDSTSAAGIAFCATSAALLLAGRAGRGKAGK